MSELVGTQIVGFLTHRLIWYLRQFISSLPFSQSGHWSHLKLFGKHFFLPSLALHRNSFGLHLETAKQIQCALSNDSFEYVIIIGFITYFGLRICRDDRMNSHDAGYLCR